MDRGPSTAARVASLIVACSVAVLVWALGAAQATATAACPYGYNKDGSCREEPFSTKSPPSRQRVTFRTDPPGAAIFIDGEPLLDKDGAQATTNYTHKRKLEPKLSLVELRLDGYEPAKIWRRIERYGRQEIEHKLVPLVPIKVHNLTDAECVLEVERIDDATRTSPDRPAPQVAETSPPSRRWVSLRRRVLPGRTTITVELAGPGRYQLSCSADRYLPQCKTVELELDEGHWHVLQFDACGEGELQVPPERGSSVDLQLRAEPACVRIDPKVADLPLRVWTASDPVGCGEMPTDAPTIVGGTTAAVCEPEPDASSRISKTDAPRLLDPAVIEYGGARHGERVCIRVPALPERPTTEVLVEGPTTVIGLPLLPVEGEEPEVVTLGLKDVDDANETCRDESKPAVQRARACAHLAFLLDGRWFEDTRAKPQSLPRSALRQLGGSSVPNADPVQLWERACELDDARACEAAGVRTRGCAQGDLECTTAEQHFERACELGRRTACLRRVAPQGATWPGIDELYRLADDHPLQTADEPDPRRRSKHFTSPLAYPAIQLGFDPSGLSRSYQVQASWLNLFGRERVEWVGLWAKVAAPTLVSFEQRVVEDDVVRTRRIYGGQLVIEGIGRLYAELLRKRDTELLLFASLGLGYGVGWVDGFRLSGDALAGAGFTINGWGIDAGVRTLRAPYTRSSRDGTTLRSSVPRLGVYVSLETNFELGRRRGGWR